MAITATMTTSKPNINPNTKLTEVVTVELSDHKTDAVSESTEKSCFPFDQDVGSELNFYVSSEHFMHCVA